MFATESVSIECHVSSVPGEGPKVRFLHIAKCVLLVTFTGILYYFFVKTFHIGIPCVFHLATGYLCPGCGMTHAALEIANGNLYTAASYNLLSVTVVPLLLLFLAIKAFLFIKTARFEFRIYETVFLFVLCAACISYGIARNVMPDLVTYFVNTVFS